MRWWRSWRLRRIERKCRTIDARLDRLAALRADAEAQWAEARQQARRLGGDPRPLSVQIQEDAESARVSASPADRVVYSADREHRTGAARGVTTDPTDPRLTHGDDTEPREQADAYLVLSPEETAKGYVRPFRKTYVHEKCGAVTTMGDQIAATYARDPGFYGGTYCATCRMHRPVGANGEFVWDDGSGQKVGT